MKGEYTRAKDKEEPLPFAIIVCLVLFGFIAIGIVGFFKWLGGLFARARG